ncbi:MAG: 3-deoxy-8-phosphooctulonate synthase [Planctomycetes bacterium RBG_13_44_8b]|nr:MAG: 3-deoxy-8-phosphooctulonate synthase [Planctomycetes bacterium RBG_13_44_8b]
MFKIANVKIEPDGGLFVIAGPCVIETEQICIDIARRLVQISKKTGIPIIFKASFDKANRSSIDSFRGLGLQKGLEILANVKKATSLAVTTDVHEVWQAISAAEVVDCLQVPAFLCRQTDLLVACGKTGKPVNVKKGQFMSPDEMKNAVEKIRSTGNEQILLTERGTFFGYNRLVNDMTAIPTMKKLGCLVVFDATHSTQQPGGQGKTSAGARDMAPVLAKAAVAAGTDGLFVEVHTDVEKSKSDATSIMPIEWLEKLLIDCKKIYEIARS